MKIPITSPPASTVKNKTGSWRTYKPITDHSKCTSCGTCSGICPEGIIAMKTDNSGKAKPVTDYDYCKGCGLCAEACPVKAIKMDLDNL